MDDKLENDNQLEKAKQKLKDSYAKYYSHRNSRKIKVITSRNVEEDIKRRKHRT